MASPKQLAHFVLATRNHDQLINWYLTMLDAKLRFNNGILAFISFDEEHHRVAIANLEALGDPRLLTATEGTLQHVAFTFGNVGELLENYDRLKQQGHKPYWCINHGITFSIYYGDPDGNQIEFQVDCFGDADTANSFIEGPIFARNPIGVEFDPDAMLARHRAGASEEELLRFDPEAAPAPIRQSAERNNPLFPPQPLWEPA